jgi:ABC-type uncharacterized transport system substrate-binding protein
LKKCRIFTTFLIISMFFLGFFSPIVCFSDSGISPVTNNGRHWRIAYYEGGSYIDYGDCMHAIIKGLMELGWIDKANLPRISADGSKPYWEWLAKKSKSRFLVFQEEDAYSANWSDEMRVTNRDAVLEKLKSGKIDLVIAMGTWAGQDLANNEHRVPTVVVSTSNPVRANIIKSAEDSGFDHVTARVDPTRYLRQIRMFHRLVDFKKLGVAYEDTPDGKLFSALPDLEKVAAERGFELVRCTFDDSQEDREAAGRACLECIKQLAANSDAVYLTALLAVDERIDQIIEILRNEKSPSFSMLGSKYVKIGALMSISTDEGYSAQGIFDAEKIAKILNGTKPRNLKQEFPDPLDIAINTETARVIGFEVPKSILRIAHEIYGEREK